MKTFEERYTAWIDGKLSEGELQRFQAELAEHPDALLDKEEASKLGVLLRQYASAPPLQNPDFFNHQLLARIEAEEVRTKRKETPFSIWNWLQNRSAWMGAAACAVGMALVLSQTLSHRSTDMAQQGVPADYMVEIVEAKAPEPGVWVTALHSDEDDVTVLWVDGLDYLPASYQLQ